MKPWDQPMLVGRTPRGTIEHPLHRVTFREVLSIWRKLAPFVPDAEWSIRPRPNAS
jgi:hypothetical protein